MTEQRTVHLRPFEYTFRPKDNGKAWIQGYAKSVRKGDYIVIPNPTKEQESRWLVLDWPTSPAGENDSVWSVDLQYVPWTAEEQAERQKAVQKELDELAGTVWEWEHRFGYEDQRGLLDLAEVEYEIVRDRMKNFDMYSRWMGRKWLQFNDPAKEVVITRFTGEPDQWMNKYGSLKALTK